MLLNLASNRLWLLSLLNLITAVGSLLFGPRRDNFLFSSPLTPVALKSISLFINQQQQESIIKIDQFT